MSEAGDKKTKGLTMPSNPALELQRMMLEEMNHPVPAHENETGALDKNEQEDENQDLGQQANQLTNEQTDELTSLLDNETTNQREAGTQETSVSPAPGKDPLLPKRRKAYQLSKRLADTNLKVIGLKVPEGLNDYLDEYYLRHRKTGIKKQDLVKLALQWLVVHIETGDRIEDQDQG